MGYRIDVLPVGIMPPLTLIGCVYLVLTLRYWFWRPAIGIAMGDRLLRRRMDAVAQLIDCVRQVRFKL